MTYYRGLLEDKAMRQCGKGVITLCRADKPILLRLQMIEGVGYEVVWHHHELGSVMRERFKKRATAYAFYDDKLRQLSAEVAARALGLDWV